MYNSVKAFQLSVVYYAFQRGGNQDTRGSDFINSFLQFLHGRNKQSENQTFPEAGGCQNGDFLFSFENVLAVTISEDSEKNYFNDLIDNKRTLRILRARKLFFISTGNSLR